MESRQLNIPVISGSYPQSKMSAGASCCFRRSFLLLILFLFVFSSCLTLKKGYIQHTEVIEQQIFCEPVDSLLPELQAEKRKLMGIADTISAKFPHKASGVFSPEPINALFDNLQANLSVDSALHAMFRCSGNRDALKTLLESADSYNRCFRNDRQIRRMVNRGNNAAMIPRGVLNKTQRFLLSPTVRKEAGSSLPGDLKKASTMAEIGFVLCRRGDRLNEAGYRLMNGLSGLFGNFVGSFNKKPDSFPGSEDLLSLLKPLDIILVKSEKHLTDKFIPGFFGHAAIYTGTRSDLESAGCWELPPVIRYHPEISSGKIFAEGLRSGMQLSSPGQFIDGEIFLIIRMENISDNERKTMVRRLFSQITKKYDFNFDILSPDKIFCSELVFLVFDQVRWLTHKTFGRLTITPDEIAESVLLNPRMRFAGLLTPAGATVSPPADLVFRLMEK